LGLFPANAIRVLSGWVFSRPVARCRKPKLKLSKEMSVSSYLGVVYVFLKQGILRFGWRNGICFLPNVYEAFTNIYKSAVDLEKRAAQTHFLKQKGGSG